MIDFSNYPINKSVFFSGAERKEEIVVDGFRYIIDYSVALKAPVRKTGNQ